jgi:translation initiation factor IF-2
LARRIFEIAKELGVDSKAIVGKCQAEGISADVIKNHMSTVSAGLEATIREWFSVHDASSGSAVETAEKVDLDKVKSKSTRRRKKGEEGGEGHADGHDGAASSVVTEEPPSVGATEVSSPVTVEVSGGPDATSAIASDAPSTAPATARALDTPRTPDAHSGVHSSTDARDANASQASSKAQDGVSEPIAAAPAAPSTAAPVPAPGPTTVAPAAAVSIPAPAPARDIPSFARQTSMRVPAAPPIRQPTPQGKPAQPPQQQRPNPAAPQRPGAPTPYRPGGAPSTSGPSTGAAPTGAGSPPGVQQVPPSGPTGPGSGPRVVSPAATSAPGAPGAPGATGTAGTGSSAQPNRPVRPAGLSPVGPRLTQAAPVRIAGPKVVRVEAPEQVAAPRARRPMGPGGPAGPGAGGPGGAAARGPRTGTEDDDRSRSPRRKAGAGAGAAGPGSKRSTGAGIPSRRRATSGEEWTGGQIFSEQDIIEREERLARAKGFLKQRKQDLSRTGQNVGSGPSASDGRIRIAAPFTLKDLSAATGVKVSEISKRLFTQGLMFKINDPMPVEKAIEIMMDFDLELEVTEAKTAEETVSSDFANRERKDVRPRGAVVTILGHVDHGKTSLLDKIRNANVAAGEAGGITQKTSAFVAEVSVEDAKKSVVFLDTPGHEAFTSMRARGAKMTDVVVLVVSAPEGCMPQTIESINHAKAAGVPIVVALNKVDRPDATEQQVQKTLGELAKAGLNPVEWGGETEVVRTSAVSGVGIPQLLEVLDYQSQLLNLEADFDGPAQGTVIEAKTEEGRGAVANLLVQQGRLKVGDFVVMGRAHGRVRDITDDRGRRIKEALPPVPVQISGIDAVCDAGDKFYVVESLKKAQEAAEQRIMRERQAALAAPKLTLDSLFSQIQSTEGDSKEIRVILKTDQQGTVDVLKAECEKIKTAEVRVRVIDSGVGGITESNVLLAEASKAIVIGFNVVPSGKARQLSEQKGVEIRTYEVIYDITDDLKKAAEGLLSPDIREELLGHADVRAVFKVTKVGNIAGCYVTDGMVARDALIRVTRDGVVVESNRKLSQLKRVKDDAREVRAGLECGMKIDGYDDIKVGDILECYKRVEVKRTL